MTDTNARKSVKEALAQDQDELEEREVGDEHSFPTSLAEFLAPDLRDPVKYRRRAAKFLTMPVEPFNPRAVNTVDEALDAMAKCSFQARQLGRALEVFWRMANHPGCLKVLALAGAMVPAGMGEAVCVMIEEGFVDAIVSTGANITHDLVNSVKGAMVKGNAHFVGHPHVNDGELFDLRINRIYDTFLPDEYYNAARAFYFQALVKLYGTGRVVKRPSEVFADLGLRLPRRSFVKVAAEHGVPVFCGATSDSDFGMLLAEKREKGELNLVLDELGDVIEFGNLVKQYDAHGNVIVGGGVPRNWVQQIFPFLELKGAPRGEEGRGYEYSVRFHTALEYDGGLSGCTIAESKSWGKYVKGARHASVWVDATIALPLVVTAMVQRKKEKRKA
ncbi:MAG: deoxyhypusine synthase [Promethearchaeota archaeon]